MCPPACEGHARAQITATWGEPSGEIDLFSLYNQFYAETEIGVPGHVVRPVVEYKSILSTILSDNLPNTSQFSLTICLKLW